MTGGALATDWNGLLGGMLLAIAGYEVSGPPDLAVERSPMKCRAIFVVLLLATATFASTARVLAQESEAAKETKEAAKETKEAVKDGAKKTTKAVKKTGKKIKKETKKVVKDVKDDVK